MSTYRRLHERPLIEEILGERYEPHMSDRSPDAPEEDPSTIEARKRADALGRSGHQVTVAPHAADAGFAGFGPPPLSAAAAESRDPPPAPATAEARDRAQGGGSRGNQGFPRDQWRRRESNPRPQSHRSEPLQA